MVCGSRSLVNILPDLGGKMPANCAQLLKPEPVKISREVVLHFSKSHRVRLPLCLFHQISRLGPGISPTRVNAVVMGRELSA